MSETSTFLVFPSAVRDDTCFIFKNSCASCLPLREWRHRTPLGLLWNPSSSWIHLMAARNQSSENSRTIDLFPASQCPWKPDPTSTFSISLLWGKMYLQLQIQSRFPLNVTFLYSQHFPCILLVLMLEGVGTDSLKDVLGIRPSLLLGG